MDLTLVDTTCLEELRHKREWSQVYNLIPQTSMYAGMADVLEVIRKHNIKTAIVSTSPRPYIERLIAFYNIPAQYIVSYHDAKPIKPHPAPMLKALEFMQTLLQKLSLLVTESLIFRHRMLQALKVWLVFGERKKRASCYNQAILMQLLDLMRY